MFPSKSVIEELVSRHGYVLKEEIGKGQYGYVYKIQSPKYSEDFALKYIPINKNNKLINQDMEHLALQKLTHSNILSIYDVWEEAEGICIITEFCECGSYADVIKSKGPLPKHTFVAVAKQLLMALQYLHKKGFSHNDVKPANILIDKYGRPKLADFGLCALADGKRSETVVRGTPLTMAPELFRNKPYNSFKSDIWSMGITLYILATGTSPWGNNAKKAYAGAVSGMVYYPPNLDRQIVDLLNKMLQQKPDDRADLEVLLGSSFFESQSQSIETTKSTSSRAFSRFSITRSIQMKSMRRHESATRISSLMILRN